MKNEGTCGTSGLSFKTRLSVEMLGRNKCSVEIFENDELNLLSRYGFWIEALVDGLILPITDEEKRLIDVHAGKVEPINLQECAWRKLIERRIWEKNERESPHYKLIDKSEQWFSRSDWKKMRSQ